MPRDMPLLPTRQRFLRIAKQANRHDRLVHEGTCRISL